MAVRAQEAVAILLTLATGACGRAERQAAEARADSLQRVLQHQQDSLKGARVRRDSLKAARAESIAAERSRPRDLAIMSSTGVSIGPHTYSDYVFVLDSAADCTVHGRIEALAGGERKDVEVYLFAADDFANWKTNHSVRPMFGPGRQTITAVNAGVSQAGEYHLVVSNAFSPFSSKTVQGQVTVTCRGLQPRQP